MSAPRKNARAIAATVLAQVLPLDRKNSHPKSLAELLPQLSDAEKDQGLVQELCFGVCRWFTRLDKLAAPLLRQPFKDRDADLHALLLIGLYQMFYLRIPDHAAIAETVEAARQLKKEWAVKVINGMLRTAQREKPNLEQSLPDSAAIQTAHPQWLVDALAAAWPNQVSAVLKANNEAGPMCLRVNRLRCERDDYLRLLKQAGIDARAGTLCNSAIYLDAAVAVPQLPHFADGWVSVQDEAAQLSAFLLNPQPGERVLDACAAPGGKTCHLLEQQPDIGELIALDADAKRLQRVEQNLARLQLTATVVHATLEDYATHYQGEKFDRILLDAPCSATGVIRRHPDIKWLRKRSDISKLAATQQRLLEMAFGLLKPGGTLLYATCSVLPQENSRVVHGFLKQQKSAVEDVIVAPWGEAVESGRQLFPQPKAHDGFYYARVKRSGEAGN
jgi:16S rRNA (cytosine967-C5)-methyltransferase